MSSGSGLSLICRRMCGVSKERTIGDGQGTKHVIPNRSNRKRPFSFSKRLYKLRWRIEAAFNRLKDFRRIATRYDKLARNYLASVCLAAVTLATRQPRPSRQRVPFGRGF